MKFRQQELPKFHKANPGRAFGEEQGEGLAKDSDQGPRREMGKALRPGPGGGGTPVGTVVDLSVSS